ncbi:tRNA pseudouridine(55) synthase TruB [Streptococcus hongkongensis]|nr:tRNA pseudouridine synthase B [Streptococcus uberis]
MKSGLINVKKEAGMTSHDVVFKLRRILQEKKIGHGGTLDPDVVGVLPIAVGKATRVIEYMTDSGKIYEGQVTLGFSTTTEDASGDVIDQLPVSADLTEEKIDACMATFLGDITQIPPMYSAVKVNGRKLYEYARAGQSVERPQRQVTIYQFERTSPLLFEEGLCRFTFKVACSKGTYVRTLAVNLGEKLGYPSHMSQLIRTASAGLTLDEALNLSEIENLVKQDDWSFILPISYGVSDLPKLMISESEKEELSFGRRISLPSQENLVAAFFNDQLVAVLEKREDGYKPRKVLL